MFRFGADLRDTAEILHRHPKALDRHWGVPAEA
jgi:hypothetical protein